jgi:hypothetical protein
VPEVTAGSTPGHLAVPAGSGPWPGVRRHSFMSPKRSLLAPLVKLVRLDFRPACAADAWQRIFTFFGEFLR